MRAALLVLVVCAACASGPQREEGEVALWPEASRLFHQNPDWRGGDAAYSIDLGDDRTLWLFGDSFVARPGADGRAGCAMPRNTIALQEGRDPRTARMTFAWKGTIAQPSAWFESDGEVWHWPLHGLRIGDAVIVFCSRIEATGSEGPFGFRAAGWTAFRVTGVDGPIGDWQCERVATPTPPFAVVVGTSVVAHEAHVYAYALREPGDHAVFAVRWPREDFAAGELMAPEWFGAGNWRPQAEVDAYPTPVLAEGAPEFSVHALPGGGFAMVQTVGFGDAELAVRTAPRPDGPWSEARVVFRPPESDLDGVFVYAGKGHAGLWSGGLLATYASNAWDFGRLVRDSSLYFPCFVRLPWAELLRR